MNYYFPDLVEKVGENYTEKSFYLGFEPSGTFHLGHYMMLKKLKSLSKTSKCKILLADVHARLNSKKDVDLHVQKSMEFLKIYAPDVQIVLGSDLLKQEKFWESLLKFSGLFNINEVRRGLPLDLKKNYDLDSELLKTPFNMWLYPLFQAIDPHHLQVEGVLAGKDQRNIYMLMRDNHYKKLNWKTPNCYFYPLLDLSGQINSEDKKMSSSGKNIPLDGNLVRNLSDYLSGKTTQSLLDFIKQSSVLNLYEVSSKKELIESTYEDLKNLKSFYF